jgi:putative transposase
MAERQIRVPLPEPTSVGLELYQGLKQWFNDYNTVRRHTSLDGEVPTTAYSA